METSKISFLCKLSDRIYDDAKYARGVCSDRLRGLSIRTSYGELKLDFDNYEELKPVAEKLLEYLVKSENKRQNEIKLEIIKLLGK